ncbi:MAG: hypothetical protein WC651_03285 [Candidatus Gracilibacteria bacterium]|jgi:hypothetical protein
MARISVTINQRYADKLSDIALHEKRSTSNMAAIMLERAIQDELRKPEWQPMTPEQIATLSSKKQTDPEA